MFINLISRAAPSDKRRAMLGLNLAGPMLAGPLFGLAIGGRRLDDREPGKGRGVRPALPLAFRAPFPY